MIISDKLPPEVKRKLDSDEDLSDKGEVITGKKIKKLSEDHVKRYIESINIKKLDFDQEKVCSITLSRSNVYCCLVCGRYLQGRNQTSVAFKHAVEEDHHLFLSFNTLKAYVLPENYELPSNEILQNLIYAVNPTFQKQNLSSFPQACHDSNGKRYMNGFVGLNSVTPDGYSTCILHVLAHIIPLRDYFLLSRRCARQENRLLDKISLLTRKLWSVKLLRTNISPSELLHAISETSNRKFPTDESGDPRQFLLWLIITLSSSREETLKRLLESNIQGKVEIKTTLVESIHEEEGNVIRFRKLESKTKIQLSNFWCLTLDLPPMPLFRASNGVTDKDRAPQTLLSTLLEKFNGFKEVHVNDTLRTFKIIHQPKYLIFHYNRFEQGIFNLKARNQTLVEFPLEIEIGSSSYKLIVNIVHETVKEGRRSETEDNLASRWKTQIRNEMDDQWYEFDDVEVKQVEKEFLFLHECYLQIWEAL